MITQPLYVPVSCCHAFGCLWGARCVSRALLSVLCSCSRCVAVVAPDVASLVSLHLEVICSRGEACGWSCVMFSNETLTNLTGFPLLVAVNASKRVQVSLEREGNPQTNG